MSCFCREETSPAVSLVVRDVLSPLWAKRTLEKGGQPAVGSAAQSFSGVGRE